MCLLVFYINPEAKADEFCLILVNVRDEIYDRPTKQAEFWQNHPNVIGGTDMEPGKEGGTWFALNKSGKIGALLNILQPDEDFLPNKKGRGCLVVDFVSGNEMHSKYLHDISSTSQEYNGFLLVTIELSDMTAPGIAYFITSTNLPPVTLKPGIHAFGNSVNPNEPWPKAKYAKEKFNAAIKDNFSVSSKSVLIEKLFCLLNDSTSYELDENIKKQGRSKSPEFLKKLNSIFVSIPEANYGSRCHTIVLIDGSGYVDYIEKSRDETLPPNADKEWSLKHYNFKLNSMN